jgi:integrase
LVSSIFGRALEWSLVKDNPVKGIRRNREHSRDRFLQSHELPRFFEALTDEPNETTRDYIFASLLTGARRANVLSMKWADINMIDQVWRIPDTKSGEPQNVVLTGPMMELLQGRRDQTARTDVFVFPGVGERGHLVEPRKAWVRLFDRDELSQIRVLIESAGGQFAPLVDPATGDSIPEALPAQLERAKSEAKSLGIDHTGLRMEHLRIHDLRRTMGSWQAIGGESLTVIGKSLGHKNVATTAIYARLQLDPVRASMEKATEAMFAAGGARK